MLVLVLCQPDAAKKVSLVCPSLVTYPDAMATITVAIFNSLNDSNSLSVDLDVYFF